MIGLSSTMDNLAACWSVLFSGKRYPEGVVVVWPDAEGTEGAGGNVFGVLIFYFNKYKIYLR